MDDFNTMALQVLNAVRTIPTKTQKEEATKIAILVLLLQALENEEVFNNILEIVNTDSRVRR